MSGSLTPDQLFALLDSLEIPVETWWHPPLRTVEDGIEHWRDIPAVHCKNLFLRDAKKAYWLVSAPIDRDINLKTLPARIHSKRLSFASGERLRQVLAVEPGGVTPFALINDAEHQVRVVLDAWMMTQDRVAFHPLTNRATTALSPQHLLRFMAHCGHQPDLVDLADLDSATPEE